MPPMNELVDLQMLPRKDPEAIEIAPDAMSLDLLQAVYRCNDLPLSLRMRAASLAIGYECPKLAVVAQVSENDIATLLDKRIARYQAMQNASNAKLIEAKPASDATTTTDKPTNENGGSVDARLPPPIPDRRYRRF